MTTTDKVIKTNFGLSELGKQLGDMTQACPVTGHSPGQFYRSKILQRTRRDSAARDLAKQPNVRIDCREIEKAGVELASFISPW
jgi:hypothetical protein